MLSFGLILAALAASSNAYWLMGIEDFITTERIDPIVNPGKVSGHVHSVLGGSNFRFTTNTAALRESECTSVPIPQDKSNYWFPHLYFQWKNGSFSSLDGGAVIYYLFSDTPGTTTAFPDDFRMLSGDPTLRTYDPNSHAQQAVTFLCLDFNGVTTKFNSLPQQACPSGIRAQINFPSCWDGKNTDSPDHKSHVAFLSGGPDSGTCSDPNFPVTLPRIFMELYWSSNTFDSFRDQAMNTTQPFVFSYGDRTGYGYHADFLNGWDAGVLQKAVDQCHCNPYGDPTCCAQQGIFDLNQGKSCRITRSVDEQTTGTLAKLPGNNPVQEEGQRATMFSDTSSPALIAPVFAYTGNTPTQTGQIVSGSAPTGGNLAIVSSDAPEATSSSEAHAASSSAAAAASSVHVVAGSSSVVAAAASSAHPVGSTSVAATTSTPIAAGSSSVAAATSSVPVAVGSSSVAAAASTPVAAGSSSVAAAASSVPVAVGSSSSAAAASSAPAVGASSAAAASSAPVAVGSSSVAAAASSTPVAAGTSVIAPAQYASSAAAAAASSSTIAHNQHGHGNGQQDTSSNNSSSSSPSSSSPGSCKPKNKERRSPIARRFAPREPEAKAASAPRKRGMHRAARSFPHDTHARNTF